MINFFQKNAYFFQFVLIIDLSSSLYFFFISQLNILCTTLAGLQKSIQAPTFEESVMRSNVVVRPPMFSNNEGHLENMTSRKYPQKTLCSPNGGFWSILITKSRIFEQKKSSKPKPEKLMLKCLDPCDWNLPHFLRMPKLQLRRSYAIWDGPS